jgi:hypothetical protein
MPNKAQHQKAIAKARELCDTLLGINRSKVGGGEIIIKFTDKDVCKYTLCGVCPHRLFLNTKSDLGPCSYSLCGLENPKLADPIKEWQSLPQSEKDKYGYEYKTMVYLQKLVRGCDSKIIQSKNRLEREERPVTMSEMNEADKQTLLDIAAKMQEKTDEAQKFGDENNITEALRVMQEIDLLNKQRLQITEGRGAAAAGIKQNESKLLVCEITGHFYSSLDGEERMALYFQGKQYRGWKQVREYVQTLEQLNPPRGLREYEEQRNNYSRGSGSYGGNGKDEWHCESCGTSNFPDRYKCRKCRLPKQGGGGGGYNNGSRGRGGINDGRRDYKRQRREEWNCTSCGTSNFMDRTNCRKCRSDKNGGGGIAGGSGYNNSRGNDSYNNSRGGDSYNNSRGGDNYNNSRGSNNYNNSRGGRSYGGDSYNRGNNNGGGYSERHAPRQRRW